MMEIFSFFRSAIKGLGAAAVLIMSSCTSYEGDGEYVSLGYLRLEEYYVAWGSIDADMIGEKKVKLGEIPDGSYPTALYFNSPLGQGQFCQAVDPAILEYSKVSVSFFDGSAGVNRSDAEDLRPTPLPHPATRGEIPFDVRSRCVVRLIEIYFDLKFSKKYIIGFTFAGVPRAAYPIDVYLTTSPPGSF